MFRTRSLLQFAFGMLLGILIALALRDIASLSRLEIGGLIIGLFAAILQFWPAKHPSSQLG